MWERIHVRAGLAARRPIRLYIITVELGNGSSPSVVFLNCHPSTEYLDPTCHMLILWLLLLCSFYMHIIAHHISCQWVFYPFFSITVTKPYLKATLQDLTYFFYIHPTILTLILLLVIEAFPFLSDLETSVEIKSTSTKSISNDKYSCDVKMERMAKSDLWYLSLEEVWTCGGQLHRPQDSQERHLRQVAFTQKKVLPQERVCESGSIGETCFLPAQLVLQEYFCKHDSNPKGLKHNSGFQWPSESCASNSNESSQTFCQNIRLYSICKNSSKR